jgi:alcohol-forming fatty acyl-CoA reductase
MRVLKLAKECQKLECLCHVSTAYTNSNRRGFIEEKIYNLDRDPEEIINEVLQMNPQYISDNEQTLISGYPNTYTWTKSMAERALLKTHGHVRVALVRPSIVISSAEEPTQGWTDTLAAAGGIFFGVSSGLMHVVYADPSKALDIVPVDYVSNTVLCTTAYTARMETPQVVVCHSSSSHHNPCTIAAMREALNSYSKKFPYYRSFSHPWGFATGNS